MRVFIDTNVLVYLFDSRQQVKQRTAAEVLRQFPRPVVSTQVLGEFYVTVTRKFAKPMNPVQAIAAVDRIRGWQIVPVDEEVVSTALHLTQQYQMSYWDAQIAASAARAGCQILLTEDLSGPGVIMGVRRENPFA
jgi:predicted nucleic acid-binding protein